MGTDTLVLANFPRLMAVILLLLATLKIVLLGRKSSWDGWNIMSVSLALLTMSSLLAIFKQFGVQLVNAREIMAAVAGLLGATAFLLSTRLIKSEAETGKRG